MSKNEAKQIDSAKIIPEQKFLTLGLILLTVFLLISQCKNTSTEIKINIFAAASLADLLNEFETEYELQNDIIDLQISYGASNLLTQQIIKGAPANIFIPAGTGPIEILNNEMNSNLQIHSFISNELVVVSNHNNQFDISNLSELSTVDITRFAIADPKLAPAGEYSKIALQNNSLWEILEPKLVLASDVRAALTYISTGNAEIGMVYATDAITKPALRTTKIPIDSYPKIQYPIILIDDRNHKNEIANLIKYLISVETAPAIMKYGFIKIEEVENLGK